MPLVAAYYRPDTVEEALALLDGPHRIPLGGGTVVNGDRTVAENGVAEVEVVDLQALGLSSIEDDGGRLRIGAMATVGAAASDPSLPTELRLIARAEEPSTLRTIATVGGLVASGHRDSMLLAALLACDATIELAGADNRALAELLDFGVPAGSIITAITIDSSGHLATAATGRTPADVPIVGAVGRLHGDQLRLALTGVADVPLLVNPDDPLAGLAPDGDFRGSAEYRLELARVLTTRLIGELR